MIYQIKRLLCFFGRVETLLSESISTAAATLARVSAGERITVTKPSAAAFIAVSSEAAYSATILALSATGSLAPASFPPKSSPSAITAAASGVRGEMLAPSQAKVRSVPAAVPAAAI